MRAVPAGLVAVAVALVPAGCTADDDPNLLDVGSADFPAWSTMAALSEAGSITVGITGDEVDADGAPVGFEVEIAKMLAGALGIPAHDVRWVQAEHDHRERLIEDGHVDIVVAALPSDGAAGEIVGLAGPYHVGEHRVLVPDGAGTLAEARVCAADDVPDDAVGELGDATVVRASATACVERLYGGEVDAVYAPDLVLAGSLDGHFALLDEPRAEQAYSVGLASGDEEFRSFLEEVIDAAIRDGRWAAAWESTAGRVLGPADPPR